MTQRNLSAKETHSHREQTWSRFLSPIFQMKTLRSLSSSLSLAFIPSPPVLSSFPASVSSSCTKAEEAHAHCWPEYRGLPASTLSLPGAPHSESCACMDAWPQQLGRSHRTLQNALSLGGCNLRTKHCCSQAAGGERRPNWRIKESKDAPSGCTTSGQPISQSPSNGVILISSSTKY